MLPQNNSLLTRISAVIRIEASGQTVDARLVLHELHDAGVECFVNRYIARGERVSLILEQPERLVVQGTVATWYPFTSSAKVLGADVFRYRLGIKFHFNSPAELEALKKYRTVLQ